MTKRTSNVMNRKGISEYQYRREAQGMTGITEGLCSVDPKKPSACNASLVFLTTVSFHLQIFVSFTLPLLNSFLQDFLRVLTQSLR